MRGETYTFRIEGGNNPFNSEYYHPFIITDENIGGYGSRSEFERKQIKVFAGVRFTRRGDARPTSCKSLNMEYPIFVRKRKITISESP